MTSTQVRPFALLALASFLTTVLAAQTPRTFTSTFFFGDSLTDTGNTFVLVGQPPPPYFNGRFSNGPVYSEILVPTLQKHTTAAATVTTNLNFAFAGATAAPGSSVPNLTQQLGFFQARGLTPKATDLFVLLAGANDVLNTISNPATQNLSAVAAAGNTASVTVAGAVRTLANSGARNFIVMNLPNIAQTPRFTTGSGAPAASLAETGSLAFNTSLRGNLLAAGLPADANVTIVDVQSFVSTILRDPARFGFNITNLDVIDILSAGGNPGSFEQYVFWDSIHPTTKTHAILAGALQEILNPEFVLGTAAAQATAILGLADMTADTVDSRLDMIRHGGLRNQADGFVSVNYKDGSRDGNGFQPDYGFKATVVTAGFDYQWSPNMTVGLAFSADKMRSRFATTGGSFRVQGLTSAAFLQYQSGKFFAEATANIATHDVTDIVRPTALGALPTKGESSGDGFGGSFRMGTDFVSESLHVTPFVGVRYADSLLRRYQETGVNGLNFAFGRQRFKATTGFVGASADWTLHTGDTPLVLNLLGVYQTDIGTEGRTLSGHLADNLSRDSIISVKDGNGDSFKAGVRVTRAIGKRWSWTGGFLADFRDNGNTAKQYSFSVQTGY